ncbi:glycosyltransferase family 2 protein [Candidatus Omnitrophota bacterium]
MKFSVIIPVRNAQDTLKPCLDAVFSSENRDLEVILVDDNSADRSRAIAGRYPCKIVALKENKGTAIARNIGKEHARGETLVFLDADAVIKKNSLNIIDKDFAHGSDIVAVTGILSKECPHKNFFSQYKNLYMHYIFRRCPRFIDFLYGSIVAIKKDDFLPFNEQFKITDDTELGQRYKRLNKKILLDPELEVTHLKKYDLKSIIRNDFSVPFWWVKSFILHNGLRDVFRKKRFSHARIDQIAGILTSYIVLVSAAFCFNLAMRAIFFISIFTFFFLNRDFFIFLGREKGFLYMTRSALFNYLDALVMGLGISAGALKFLTWNFSGGSKSEEVYLISQDLDRNAQL